MGHYCQVCAEFQWVDLSFEVACTEKVVKPGGITNWEIYGQLTFWAKLSKTENYQDA